MYCRWVIIRQFSYSYIRQFSDSCLLFVVFHGNGNVVHMRGDAWLVFCVTFANLKLQTRNDYVIGCKKKKVHSRIECLNAFAELQLLESPSPARSRALELAGWSDAHFGSIEVKWKPISCQHSPVPVSLAKHHHGGANYSFFYYYWMRELIEGELAV